MNTDESTQGISICLHQVDLRPPDESPLAAARTVAKHIRQANSADLHVLPELAPLGYSEHTFRDFCNEQGRTIVEQVEQYLRDTAQELHTCICFGTIGMVGTNVFTIRQLVVNGKGDVIASYDKMHLCDYGVCAETRFFAPGKDLCSFTIQTKKGIAMRFGLLICADMRYPMLAQQLTREHQVDVIVQPAAFARDLSFRTWESFRETRAVENSVYWVAVNYAGTNFGASAIVPPWVDEEHEPTKLGTESTHLVGFLSQDELQSARTSMPFYQTLMKEHVG